MKSAAAAASRTIPDVFMTQVLAPGSGEIVTFQKSLAAAVRTFHRSKLDNKKAAQTGLRHALSHLYTAISKNLSESTVEPSFSASSAFFSPSPSTFSGLASFRRLARSCGSIPALVVGVSSDDYIEAKGIRQMIMAESGGRSDETSRPKKRRKVTSRKRSKARTCSGP